MERELKRWRMYATVPGIPGASQSRTVTVIPDALFSLQVGGETQHLVLEVDRASEHQRIWRDKVAALTYWLLEPDTKKLLPSDLITVTVVTPDANRCNTLRKWTEEELRLRGLFDVQASMFAITAAAPDAMTPREFFTGKHWHPPYLGATDSLVDPPDNLIDGSVI
jgi:hypothetical protein